MSVLERIGEKILSIAERIGEKILSVRSREKKVKKIGTLLEEVIEKETMEIPEAVLIEANKVPSFMRKFMLKRCSGNLEYHWFRITLLLLLSLLALLLYMYGSLSFLHCLSSIGVLFLISEYILISNREDFKEDFSAYRDFLVIFYLTVILVVAHPFFSLRLMGPLGLDLTPLLLSISGVLLAIIYFSKRYGRDYVVGTVVKGGKLAEVLVRYDLPTNVKPGIYRVENPVDAKEGERVKVEVVKHFLRGKPFRIIEVYRD